MTEHPSRSSLDRGPSGFRAFRGEVGLDTEADTPGPGIDETAGQQAQEGDSEADIGPLDGIPSQGQYDTNALREMLAMTRAQRAQLKMNWHIAQAIGIPNVHPNSLKIEIGKADRQVELLEGLLEQGELPAPPSLEIATVAPAPAADGR